MARFLIRLVLKNDQRNTQHRTRRLRPGRTLLGNEQTMTVWSGASRGGILAGEQQFGPVVSWLGLDK